MASNVKHLSRLAPLLPQLVFAFRESRGPIPAVLEPVGHAGERHLRMVISLANEGPATVSELAERLHMTQAHASLVVRHLGDAGVVDRTPDPADRRRTIVSLSDAAAPAVAELHRKNSDPLRRFLSDISDDDAERFISLLERLIEQLRDAKRPDV
jgi:DNA-binding MarR family transcriptional regulator